MTFVKQDKYTPVFIVLLNSRVLGIKHWVISHRRRCHMKELATKKHCPPTAL
jgi:hypothetical protein